MKKYKIDVLKFGSYEVEAHYFELKGKSVVFFNRDGHAIAAYPAKKSIVTEIP